jgi:intracellular sulfur oxidation DsrE/DsrF family protein
MEHHKLQNPHSRPGTKFRMIMKTLIIFALSAFVTVNLYAQARVNPVIKSFGTITEIAYAVEKPDPKLDYKIVVEINTDNAKPETVHEFFEKTAAVVNLHALGGVPADKLHVVMVVHGPAAQFIVNNAAYQKKFGMDNPNLALFTALEKAGVKLFICGQSMVKRNIDPATVAPEVKVSLSAITALTTYQLKGYSLLKY